MKARLLVALAALAVAGVGCGGITSLDPDAGGKGGAAGNAGAGGKGGAGGAGGGAGSAGGAGGAGGSCQGLTGSDCTSRPDCVLEPGCQICPWDQPTPICAPRGSLEVCPAIACFDPCVGLAQDACAARQDCTVTSCPTCGGTAFAGCVHVGAPLPQCPAPPPCPPPPVCTGLTEAACMATQGCGPRYCPGCQGQQIYAGCTPPGATAPACPAIACPVTCSGLTTEATCDARSDCHSVFYDPGTCGCAVSGCCAKFSRCADGPANCKGAVACAIASPFCEAPYVISYTQNCYEGCVRATECPATAAGP
jgi:hypothetical protein